MKLRASASQAGASPRSCMTVYSAIHEDREQQNDRQWDANKPKQRTFSETHGRLRVSLQIKLVPVPLVPRGRAHSSISCKQRRESCTAKSARLSAEELHETRDQSRTG